MELNREQIIKALECCNEHEYCLTCPCDDECIDMESLMLDALSLIKELTEENERLKKALTAKGDRKQEDVLQELNDKVVKKYLEERSVFLEERKNVGKEEGTVFWYIQGRIDGMEWVTDTVRFTKNEMIDQIAKEMLEEGK